MNTLKYVINPFKTGLEKKSAYKSKLSYPFLCILLLLATYLPSHAQYKSWNGKGVSPFKTYRCLNVYIDIIYDLDSIPERESQFWATATEAGINKTMPTYAGTFFLPDTSEIPSKNGSLTKRFYEASFGNFTFLGDAVSVSVLQSSVSQYGYFTWQQLVSKAIQIINNAGGLDGLTLAGYDHIEDYSLDGDTNIDIINFMFKNTTAKGGGITQGGYSGDFYNVGILMHGKRHNANHFTAQLVGTDNLLNGNSTILDHELGHQLFGGNEFHASGGNHFNTHSACTFMGIQSGYGIMGVGRSNLVCTNAYERWRMHWTSKKYNPDSTLIQAGNVPSDITQKDGKQTFYLRDFMTTGDAIRIKLPYKDSEASSNQYIWIENHQIGRNHKEDFYRFRYVNCQDYGVPGVFAYLQVGKDVLESKNAAEVWPSNETDNLRMITAEGNYDMEYVGLSNDCAGWNRNRKVFKYTTPNALSGQNDLTAIFNISDGNKLSSKQENSISLKQLADGTIANGWPRHGENNDVFVDGDKMNLSSNPAPINAITNYLYQGGGSFRPLKTNRNNRTLYLTGLNISFYDDKLSDFGDSCRVMRVEIVWDDYNIKNDVRWTGNIALKEQLTLHSNCTLLLDQSTVPTQITRDTTSNEFTATTMFTCMPQSTMEIKKGAVLELRNKSSFILKPDSKMILKRRAQLVVKSGCTFTIEKDAIFKKQLWSSIIVEPGAQFINHNK